LSYEDHEKSKENLGKTIAKLYENRKKTIGKQKKMQKSLPGHGGPGDSQKASALHGHGGRGVSQNASALPGHGGPGVSQMASALPGHGGPRVSQKAIALPGHGEPGVSQEAGALPGHGESGPGMLTTCCVLLGVLTRGCSQRAACCWVFWARDAREVPCATGYSGPGMLTTCRVLGYSDPGMLTKCRALLGILVQGCSQSATCYWVFWARDAHEEPYRLYPRASTMAARVPNDHRRIFFNMPAARPYLKEPPVIHCSMIH
jgi:hypothetical protein